MSLLVSAGLMSKLQSFIELISVVYLKSFEYIIGFGSNICRLVNVQIPVLGRHTLCIMLLAVVV